MIGTLRVRGRLALGWFFCNQVFHRNRHQIDEMPDI